MQEKRTKEEQMLLAIYESKTSPLDRVMLGKRLRFHDKESAQIIQLLAHGNCIRKIDDRHIELTEHGEKICKQIRKSTVQ